MDWGTVDATRLFEVIRDDMQASDAERMIWVWEQVLAVGRIDPSLLDELAAAAICGLAFRDDQTPRATAEALFRRAVADDRWRSEYASLLGRSQSS